MKSVMRLGLLLLAIGGVLMLIGTIPRREKHEANIMGAEISLTTHEERRIPYLLSGTLLQLGATLTIIGAVKTKSP